MNAIQVRDQIYVMKNVKTIPKDYYLSDIMSLRFSSRIREIYFLADYKWCLIQLEQPAFTLQGHLAIAVSE